MRLPQPSPAGPHWIPWSAHVFALQPPASGHAPQPLGIRLPHPSPAGPQVMPWSAQVTGWHPLMPPHLPATLPPPHVCGGVQVPQLWMMPPQPLLAGPHSWPAGQP
jgi:hypothetical protein